MNYWIICRYENENEDNDKEYVVILRKGDKPSEYAQAGYDFAGETRIAAIGDMALPPTHRALWPEG